MIKILLYILTPIIVIIAVGWILLFVFNGDLKDRRKAMSIPKYPNATNWKVMSSCGIPGEGSCAANIFFFTNDSREAVFNYYRNEFPKRGISFSKESSPPNNWIDFSDGLTNIELGVGVRKLSGESYNYDFSVTSR